MSEYQADCPDSVVHEGKSDAAASSLEPALWRLAGGLGAIGFVLFLPSLLVVVFDLHLGWPVAVIRHFEPAQEANLFTWYSSFLLVLVALAAMLNFWLEGQRRFGPAATGRYWWIILGVLPLALSADEVGMLHEGAGSFLTEASWLHPSMPWLQWAGEIGRNWIIVYLPGIVLAVTGLIMGFRRLLSGRRRPFMVACGSLGLWFLSLLLEFFGKDIKDACGYSCKQDAVVVEEFCEMFGSLGLLVAFLDYARSRVEQLVAWTSSTSRDRIS